MSRDDQLARLIRLVQREVIEKRTATTSNRQLAPNRATRRERTRTRALGLPIKRSRSDGVAKRRAKAIAVTA